MTVNPIMHIHSSAMKMHENTCYSLCLLIKSSHPEEYGLLMPQMNIQVFSHHSLFTFYNHNEENH